jgi:aminocarboxymuconate-semialdehyde decarboxylase
MLGSDAPFPIGDLAPRKIVKAAGFSAEDMESINGGLAERLFLQ